MGLKLQNTTRKPGKHTFNCSFCQNYKSIFVLHLLVLTGNRAYLTDKLSTHNQSQWGFDGRNMQLCSPHVRAVAAPAVNAAQSRAGTPTVQETPSSTQNPFYRKMRWSGKNILSSYQKVLCQGNFLWYLEVQSSSYITSLQNTHLNLVYTCQDSTISLNIRPVMILKPTETTPT